MNLSRLADRWQGASPEVLSVLRFMAAFLYIEYGFSKLIQYPPTTIHFTPGILTTIAGPLEVICGALLLVGLFSRLAAIVVVGEMVVAYYHVHLQIAFWPITNHGQTAFLLFAICLFISAAGPGPWSLDAWWRGRQRESAAAAPGLNRQRVTAD